MFRDVIKRSRSGKTLRVIKQPVRKHPLTNPVVERCSFGNFEVRHHHLCDEWRSRSGEVLDGEGSSQQAKPEVRNG